jgi:hypothetical protein
MVFEQGARASASEDEEDEETETGSDSDSFDEQSWCVVSRQLGIERGILWCADRISWFCSLKGNEFFCAVDADYIRDDFNLSGLSAQARCRAASGGGVRAGSGRLPAAIAPPRPHAARALALRSRSARRGAATSATLRCAAHLPWLSASALTPQRRVQMPHGYYDYALDLILDEDVQADDGMTEEQHEVVECAAELLYGLIHACVPFRPRVRRAAQWC